MSKKRKLGAPKKYGEPTAILSFSVRVPESHLPDLKKKIEPMKDEIYAELTKPKYQKPKQP